MGILDTLTGNGRSSERAIREDLKRERWQSQYLSENMQRLEQELSDEGWRKLVLAMDREFTREGLNDLMEISRAMYLSHPLIQRAVNVRAYYTWGQGIEVKSDDEAVQEKVIDPMLAEQGNKATLFSHQATILTDIDQQVDGNTFFALFTNKEGLVRVRTVPADEIVEVISSPDDTTEVWYYRRRWTERKLDMSNGAISNKQREALYPDFRYQPPTQPSAAGRIEIMWNAPIMHQRTGGLKAMQFGIPETYAALDWARAYKKFLEDWHTIVASLARFAWRLTTKGSKLQRAKDKLNTSITDDEPREHNRPPAAGSVFMGTADDDMTPIPKTGATTSADDARPSRMMVGTAMDLPDTILAGDADVGNLATAKTLDRPTELAIVNRQNMWGDHRSDMFGYAVRQAKANKVIGTDADEDVQVSFPEILEHDQLDLVKAIVSAATLDGKTDAGTVPTDRISRLLMQALGIEDVQAALDQLSKEEEDKLAAAVDRLAQMHAAQQQQPPQSPQPQPGQVPPDQVPPGEQPQPPQPPEAP